MSDTKAHLLANVLAWVEILEGRGDCEACGGHGDVTSEEHDIETCADCYGSGIEGYESAWDYFASAFLDIEYAIGSDGSYLGSKVTVAIGGPTVWIDTRRDTVVGVWGSDRIERSYDDCVALDEHMADHAEALGISR